MRKLQLSTEDLTVESFETPPFGDGPGTVRGHLEDGSLYQTCQEWDTCQGNRTCNFGGDCYTWEGGYTCVQVEGECSPTEDGTCTCPEAAA